VGYALGELLSDVLGLGTLLVASDDDAVRDALGDALGELLRDTLGRLDGIPGGERLGRMFRRTVGRVDGERLGGFDGERLKRMLWRSLGRLKGNTPGRPLRSASSIARRPLVPAPVFMTIASMSGFSTTAWPVSLSMAVRISRLMISSGCRT